MSRNMFSVIKEMLLIYHYIKILMDLHVQIYEALK